jgi:hypothetical protein
MPHFLPIGGNFKWKSRAAPIGQRWKAVCAIHISRPTTFLNVDAMRVWIVWIRLQKQHGTLVLVRFVLNVANENVPFGRRGQKNS